MLYAHVRGVRFIDKSARAPIDLDAQQPSNLVAQSQTRAQECAAIAGIAACAPVVPAVGHVQKGGELKAVATGASALPR